MNKIVIELRNIDPKTETVELALARYDGELVGHKDVELSKEFKLTIDFEDKITPLQLSVKVPTKQTLIRTDDEVEEDKRCSDCLFWKRFESNEGFCGLCNELTKVREGCHAQVLEGETVKSVAIHWLDQLPAAMKVVHDWLWQRGIRKLAKALGVSVKEAEGYLTRKHVAGAGRDVMLVLEVVNVKHGSARYVFNPLLCPEDMELRIRGIQKHFPRATLIVGEIDIAAQMVDATKTSIWGRTE
jgi:hypothetical protein